MLAIKVTGPMASLRAKAHFSIKMETNTKVSGVTTSASVLVNISIKMEQPTSGIGKTTCSRGKVKKSGLRDHDIKVITSKARNLVTECTHGPMAHFIQATGSKIKSMVWVNTSGRTVASTTDSGKKMICLATVFISIPMVFDTKANSLKIRRQATDTTSGQMAGNTMATGIGENSTDLVSSEIRRRRKKSTEYGNKASDYIGSSLKRSAKSAEKITTT